MIIRFEAGGQLIHQPCLALHQRVLIVGELLELMQQGAIRLQAPQLAQIILPRFGEQIGIDGIGLGSSWLALAIQALGVDRIDGKACFQEGGDEQAVGGLHDASDLLLVARCSHQGQESTGELAYPFDAVGDLARKHLLAPVIKTTR